MHHNNQPVSSLTQTTPGNFTNEEQLSNEVGATPTLGTTAGAGLQPVFSETEVPAVHDPHSHHTGRHIGGGVTGAGIAGAGESPSFIFCPRDVVFSIISMLL